MHDLERKIIRRSRPVLKNSTRAIRQPPHFREPPLLEPAPLSSVPWFEYSSRRAMIGTPLQPRSAFSLPNICPQRALNHPYIFRHMTPCRAPPPVCLRMQNRCAAPGGQHAVPQRRDVRRAPGGLHEAGRAQGGDSLSNRKPSLSHHKPGKKTNAARIPQLAYRHFFFFHFYNYVRFERLLKAHTFSFTRTAR